MIWLHTGQIPAYGNQIATYSDSQFSGNIYHSGTYTAVVSDTDTQAGTVDIGGMIQELESLHILQSGEYLRSVQLGAEASSGVGSLTINKLSLAVSTPSTNTIVSGTGVQQVKTPPRDIRAGRVKLTEQDIAKHLADRNTAGLDPVAARKMAGRFMGEVRNKVAMQ